MREFCYAALHKIPTTQTLYALTMKQSYSETDLLELVDLASTLWEIDYASKLIKRKRNVVDKLVPVKAIYRMVKKDMAKNEESQNYRFPFTDSNFTGVLGLAEGWSISVADRKYLEKDMVLFADDKKTILILPENRKWWESTWFHLLSISIGVIGVIVGTISCI